MSIVKKKKQILQQTCVVENFFFFVKIIISFITQASTFILNDMHNILTYIEENNNIRKRVMKTYLNIHFYRHT